MPAVYNLGQHGAPSSTTPLPSSLSSSRASSSSSFSSSLSWLGLSSPWLCGAVLVVAVLLFHHRRTTRSRGVSMSQAETWKSTKSPTPSQRSSDDRLRPEKDAFSTSTSSSSSSWSPTVATVIKHGPHASGTTATISTSATTTVRSVFPYPNPPSPTLSPMSEEASSPQDRSLPASDPERAQPISLTSPPLPSTTAASTSTSTATSSAPLPAPPRRRSYTKTSTVPVSPAPARAYTFPITADESEFQFGTGVTGVVDPNAAAADAAAPPQLAMGIELAEEVIIAAEGWRRHTRVYGGGVCRACEESEEQMRALGVKPVEMDA